MRVMLDANMLISAAAYPSSSTFEGVDVLVTGDKDFLSLALLEPKIMTMAEFMAAFS